MQTTATVSFKSLHLPRGLRALLALVNIVGTLVAGYQTALTPLTLVVDGQARRLRTHQDTVAALLMDTGLGLAPEDIVTPGLGTHLEPGLTVVVQWARPVVLRADGHSVLVRSHAASVEAELQEARVSLRPPD